LNSHSRFTTNNNSSISQPAFHNNFIWIFGWYFSLIILAPWHISQKFQIPFLQSLVVWFIVAAPHETDLKSSSNLMLKFVE